MGEPRQKRAEMIAFLRSVPMFAGLNETGLTSLALVGRVRRLSKGTILFDQASHADHAYVVRSGCIDLVLSTPDGRELVINSMRQGDVFGELGVLTGESRSTGAIAREPSEIVSIPRDEFLAELEKEPKLMRRMLETTSQRLQMSSERESALAFMDAPSRLARVLLQLSEQERLNQDLLTISQEDLAQHVGATRQTVAGILGRWRRRGWIITGRGKIMLVDRYALRRKADGGPG
jgi:CRP/FNR family transcriptional regulator, cyclic AMP receptor protein